jgi:hypothetical protein
MKMLLAVGIGALTAVSLLADARQFALAAQRWERDRSPSSLFHLATSGFFLAGDITDLG